MLLLFRWKSDQHHETVRRCDEADDFYDVTLVWNDGELQHSHWKVKVMDLFHFKQNEWRCICKSSEKQDLLLHKDYAKGKFSKSWRGNLVETILAGKWYLFPSRSLDVSHFVMEIIRYPGQCNQTVVWSGSTIPGNSFNFFQFIGSISAFYNKLVHSLMIIWWSSDDHLMMIDLSGY